MSHEGASYFNVHSLPCIICMVDAVTIIDLVTNKVIVILLLYS